MVLRVCVHTYMCVYDVILIWIRKYFFIPYLVRTSLMKGYEFSELLIMHSLRFFYDFSPSIG